MMKPSVITICACVGFWSCATAPRSAGEQEGLRQQADATVTEMTAKEPGLRSVLDAVPGYAVFPSIGKGGVLVGGAYGRGVLYEDGQPTGFVKLEQASIGLQLGGATFAELLALRTEQDIQDIKANKYNLGVGASATLIGTGAAISAVTDATAFIMTRGGLMADISVAGQRITFEPAKFR